MFVCLCADFSRRRPRKSSTPRSKASTPRGFKPRTQVPASTQKKDRKNNEEKEGPGTSSQEESGSLNAETTGIQIVNLESDDDSDYEGDDEHDVLGPEAPSTRESFFFSKISQFEETGQTSDVSETKDAERISKSEVSSNTGRL